MARNSVKLTTASSPVGLFGGGRLVAITRAVWALTVFWLDRLLWIGGWFVMIGSEFSDLVKM